MITQRPTLPFAPGWRALLSLAVALCVLLAALAPSDARRRRRRSRRRGPPPAPPAYLATASAALARGQTNRAATVLAAARRCWLRHGTRCGFTRGEFGALSGQVYLARGKHRAAIAALRRATAERPRDQGSWFYLGQALYRAGKPAQAAKALSRAPVVGKTLPAYYLLLARAQRESKDPSAARTTLDKGLLTHPRAHVLWREVAALFQTVGLPSGALHSARHLASIGASAAPTIHLSVANELLRQRQRRAAVRVLEEALLLHPEDAVSASQLARAYAELGQHLSAARLLERLTLARPKLALAVAEQYRLAGQHLAALRWNRRVIDPQKRQLQRATILLGRQSYRQAALLLKPLWRRRRLKAPLRFRLAYAALRSGQLTLARRVLRTLNKGPFAQPAKALTGLLTRCRRKPWICR